MKSLRTRTMNVRLLVLLVVVIAMMGIMIPAAHAIDFGAPSQDSCDNGSVTYTWDELGLDRPVITAMSVDGEVIADPTSPIDDSIGAVVCANVDLARKTSVTVFRRDGVDAYLNLDGAETPSGQPITAESEITITLGNLGELAEFYSFSLVHGVVSDWTTSNLGESNATLSVTLSPARTPMGSGPDFDFCTATPPNCNAESSQGDPLSASLDMDFDQEGTFESFTGAYFGLVGAMGGFVQANGNQLVASLGAPHFLEDGETLNTGSMQAFLPNDVLENIFGLDSGSVDANTFEVTREEGDEVTEGVPFEANAVDGGIEIIVDDITFSSPSYTIGLAGASQQVDLFENSVELETESGKFIVLGVEDEDAEFTQYSSAALPSGVVDPGFTYPLDLVSFTLDVDPGSTHRIQVVWESDIDVSTLTARKYNASTSVFSAIPGATLVNSQFQGTGLVVLEYDITDGGALDADGTANGIIVDPVSVASGSATGTLPATGADQLPLQLSVVALLLLAGSGLVIFTHNRRRLLVACTINK